jgi:hypothetical protein
MKHLNNNTLIKPKYSELVLDVEPTLLIKNNVVEQIRFLHEQVASKEWSGFLLVKVKGSIDDLNSIEAEAFAIYINDIGDVASTGFSAGDHLFDMYDDYPEMDPDTTPHWNGVDVLEGCRYCQIHTHHSLTGGAYFSSVDMMDLENCAENNFYISLIVAMDGAFVAKGAFVAESEIATNSYIKTYNKEVKIIHKEKSLVTCNFDIIFETEAKFIDRFDKIERIQQVKQADSLKKLRDQKNKKIQSQSILFINGKPVRYYTKIVSSNKKLGVVYEDPMTKFLYYINGKKLNLTQAQEFDFETYSSIQ